MRNKIKIISFGSFKLDFVSRAVEYYSKKIRIYTDFEVLNIKTKINYSSVYEKLNKQADILKEYIDKDAYLILCDIKGKQYKDSISFAKHFERLMETKRSIVFYIGDDEGISDKLKEIANESLGFSGLTFNHELSAVMLCEIIYRSMTIIKGHPYHK